MSRKLQLLQDYLLFVAIMLGTVMMWTGIFMAVKHITEPFPW